MHNPFEAITERLDRLENLLQSVVGQKTDSTKDSPQNEYITRHEAAVELGVCITTIDNLAKSGRIKKYRFGGKIVRLKTSEVRTALESFKGGWSRQFEKNK
jgi:excisionase family DNA binding protein